MSRFFCLEPLLLVYFFRFSFPFPLSPMQFVQNNFHLLNDLLLWHCVWSPFCSPGTSVAVSSVLLALVMAGRAAFVFPLSFLSNLAKKSASEKISFRQQVRVCGVLFASNQWMMFFDITISLYFFCSDHNMVRTSFVQIIIWWAGLMRGAVSMALAYNQVKSG